MVVNPQLQQFRITSLLNFNKIDVFILHNSNISKFPVRILLLRINNSQI